LSEQKDLRHRGRPRIGRPARRDRPRRKL